MTDNGIHVKSSSTWVRLAYMLFFGLLIAVGRMVLGIVVLGQFLMVLIRETTTITCAIWGKVWPSGSIRVYCF